MAGAPPPLQPLMKKRVDPPMPMPRRQDHGVRPHIITRSGQRGVVLACS